jgi:type IV pilus assembly protein PilQ
VLAVLAVVGWPALAHAADGLRFATAIDMDADQHQSRVAITFTSTPTYAARLDRDGKRLTIDIPNTALRGAPKAITRRAGVIGGILAQSFRRAGSKTTRILISLLEQAEHSVRVEGKRMIVTLRTKAAARLRPRPRNRSPKTSAVEQPARVLDVRYRHTELQDKVTIQLSGTTRYSRTNADGRSRLVLRRARLAKPLARTLDVSAFGGPISTVSSYSQPRSAYATVIEVEHAGAVASRVTREGTSLVWAFFKPGSLPSSMTGVAADGGAARRSRTVHVEDDIADIPKVHSGYVRAANDDVVERAAAPEEAGAFGPNLMGQQLQPARRYAGRRIDLDLKDADIHNVLRLIADVGRVNIVTADDVGGSVTIRMRNVPWDQALDVILQSKQLGLVRQGNMIRVAPLVQLEKEREMRIARQKQELQLAPLETRLIPVSYAAATDIQARAQDLLSARGSIAVDERTNVMIVRDVSGNLNQIEELTRSLDTQTPQVLIEARIVEATSRYLRDVGIQWGGDASFSAATGNPTGLAFPNSVGVVGGASDADAPTAGLSPFTNSVPNPNFAVNLPATVGTGSGGAVGVRFGSINNTINLAVRLSAAESSGMLRILSSPRILTLDNREARIAQGTLIPFSQISAQGVQTTFQEAKLQLLVKPHVTADGSVSMHVKINRDEPDFNQTSARGDPTILKREAETHLLVMDGHTAVIGGIFTRNTGRNLDQVPFFGDIPLLGLLFQRRRASDSRSELVIFLTPRIVNRAEALGR